MGAGPLPGELPTCVCVGSDLSEYLVLHIAGPGRLGAPHADPRDRAGRPRFGYVRIWIMLRREGWPDNKKRIHRLYRLEGLQVRMRARRKKRLSLRRGVVPPASGRDQAWSMDFVHDQLVTGRVFRVLTVIDQWSRESVLMEANVALTGQSVVDALETLSARRPLPKAITVDHGTEFTSKALDDWAYRRGVALDFIRPGKPVENAFIESFNGRLQTVEFVDHCLKLGDVIRYEAF